MPFSSSRIHVAVSLSLASSVLAIGFAAEQALAEPDNAWVAHMDAAGALVGRILPMSVAAARAGSDDDDEVADEHLRIDARALAALVHDLPAMAAQGASGDADPTVPLLARELKHAVDDVDHARGAHLRDDVSFVAATCIGCHTRDARGSARPRAALAPVDAHLPAWARGDVLAATRRFAAARDAYRSAVMDDAFAAREPYQWERAVRRALVLEVRVHRDPVAALDMVEQVLNTPAGAPLWTSAAQWESSLRSWARAHAATASDPYAEAERLMSEAAQLEHTPNDDGAFIVYLRATADLHDALSLSGSAALSREKKAQALAWLGVAYEALRDVDVWSLYQLYDEACIVQLPHSALARSCYVRLEQGTYAEQSGNSGAPLDETPTAFLARMHALAAALPAR